MNLKPFDRVWSDTVDGWCTVEEVHAGGVVTLRYMTPQGPQIFKDLTCRITPYWLKEFKPGFRVRLLAGGHKGTVLGLLQGFVAVIAWDDGGTSEEYWQSLERISGG